MLVLNTIILFALCEVATVLGLPPIPLEEMPGLLHVIPQRRYKRQNMDQNTADFWSGRAQITLNEKISRPINTNIAKNIILFIGDGMSVPTYAASRIYKGQLQNKTGEEETLAFDLFPYVGLSRTYCVDSQVADSACTATAYCCGIKANQGTIGVTGDVQLGDCDSSTNANNRVSSIGRWSQLEGKLTGVVTTTRVTHASPAGVYAQTAHRDWEADTDVTSAGADPNACRDIAYQLVHGTTGNEINVILGGGRQMFLPRAAGGRRDDGVNLIDSWLQQKATRGKPARYASNREELLSTPSNTEYLLGLFASSHLPYHLDSNATADPSLEELTEAAIKVLSKGPNGFFLFVEGGRIDHAHHDTWAQKALDETLEFSKAIQKAVDLTSQEDTLIVVSSDHAHTLSISGYPERGNDIFGFAGNGSDGLPYSTLSYANGLGYHTTVDGRRYDLSQDETHYKDYRFPATAPLTSETHGGDDVGIFASGPWAHLLSGSNEQNMIPHVMAYAACVGDGVTVCDVDANKK